MCFATAPHPAFLAVDVKYYLRDLSKLLALINDGPTKSFAFRRIHFLLNKFTLHTMLNSTRELSQCHPPPNMQPLCECVCVCACICLYLCFPPAPPHSSPNHVSVCVCLNFMQSALPFALHFASSPSFPPSTTFTPFLALIAQPLCRRPCKQSVPPLSAVSTCCTILCAVPCCSTRTSRLCLHRCRSTNTCTAMPLIPSYTHIHTHTLCTLTQCVLGR